jgi:hypothetical protein
MTELSQTPVFLNMRDYLGNELKKKLTKKT